MNAVVTKRASEPGDENVAVIASGMMQSRSDRNVNFATVKLEAVKCVVFLG